MTNINVDSIDDLINRKFTLQRDVLRSWDELHKMKLKHEALLSQLAHVKEQLKFECEPSLFEQMFYSEE